MQMISLMWTDLGNNPRDEPTHTADERTTLVEFLRWQRQTLEVKCSGLGPAELARRSVEPATLSLLGLLRHMADVERHWFRRVLNAEDAPAYFWSDADEDGDFNGALPDADVVAEAWDLWRQEVANAEAFVAGAPTLDVTGEHPRGGTRSLRWVLVHMIEEYARHNGHADLLRERIDGRVGY